MMNQDAELARIHAAYFSDPGKRVRLRKGEVLFDENVENDKLYCICSGKCSGKITFENENGEQELLELFQADPGDFLGVHSFFALSGLTSTQVVAVTDVELAWIDNTTPPVDRDIYGSLERQLLPVMMEEMANRHYRLCIAAKAREATLRRLHLAESLSTLGRLSAGLAHELNNAVGVLVSSSEYLKQTMQGMYQRFQPALASWFDEGLRAGVPHASEDVRRIARQIVKKHGIGYEDAKKCARILGEKALAALPQPLDEVLAIWEAGHNCRDMHLAAQHSAEIIKSIKQLGGGSQQEDQVDVNESIGEALSLLKSTLRGVEVATHLDTSLPAVLASKTELVQIWVNIIKNGCDAMRLGGTANPKVSLSSTRVHRGVEILLTNNGPEIPESLRNRLFQPNFTTKRNQGESMGLGLGLYIVKRIIDSYSGKIHVHSTAAQTTFYIWLPLKHQEIIIDEDY